MIKKQAGYHNNKTKLTLKIRALFKQNKFEQFAERIKNRNTIALDLVGERTKILWKSTRICGDQPKRGRNIIYDRLGDYRKNNTG